MTAVSKYGNCTHPGMSITIFIFCDTFLQFCGNYRKNRGTEKSKVKGHKNVT